MKRARPICTQIGMHLLCLLLLLLSACAARPRRLSRVGPILNASDLLHILAARNDSLRDLEARARLTLRIDGVRHRAAAVLRYRAPDALKLDVSGALGVGLLNALARNDSLALYLPRDNYYLKGPPAETLYRVTGVNLAYYKARYAILGLPNLSPLHLPRISRCETRGDTLFVELYDPLCNRQMWFDGATAVLYREEIYTPHGILLSRRLMNDYRDENGVVLPRRIEIVQGNDRIRIEITQRRVNTGLSGNPFSLKVPSDAIRDNGS